MHAISYEADGPDQVIKGVRLQLKRGADFIKLVADGTSTAPASGPVNPPLGQNELRAAVEVAHAAGKRVSAHAVTREGVRQSLLAGADCIEHGYDLDDATVATMREQGARLVPTLSVHGAIVRHAAVADWPKERVRKSERILADAIASTGRAFRAGVRVACGSDAGSPFNPVALIVPELRLLCEAGMTPGQALQAATLHAAEALAAQADIGSLEAGKRADVVLIASDPLRGVGALEQVLAVIKDGVVVREIRS